MSTAGCASAQSGKELAATFDSGVAAYDAGDYQKAFKIWSSIQDEDLAAMRNVAMMLRKGQGTAKDPGKAEEIYEVAAEAGLPTAQADLADMLLKGEAGKPDLPHTTMQGSRERHKATPSSYPDPSKGPQASG